MMAEPLFSQTDAQTNSPAASQNTAQAADFAHQVSETLLITLYARAVESRCAQPLVHDPVAEKIVDQLDYNFSPFAKNKTQNAVAIRARYFDDVCRAFIRRHGQANIVSLGSGLDSRNSRLLAQQDRAAQFIDIDFDDVIQTRQQLLPEADNSRMISTSALDKQWMKDLAAELNQQPLLIIAEGLMMYLTLDQVHQLVSDLRQHFPRAQLLFDATLPWYCKIKQETVRHTQAEFQSGIAHPKAFAQQHQMSLLACDNVWQLHPKRWGLLGKLARRIDFLRRVHQFLYFQF